MEKEKARKQDLGWNDKVSWIMKVQNVIERGYKPLTSTFSDLPKAKEFIKKLSDLKLDKPSLTKEELKSIHSLLKAEIGKIHKQEIGVPYHNILCVAGKWLEKDAKPDVPSFSSSSSSSNPSGTTYGSLGAIGTPTPSTTTSPTPVITTPSSSSSSSSANVTSWSGTSSDFSAIFESLASDVRIQSELEETITNESLTDGGVPAKNF